MPSHEPSITLIPFGSSFEEEFTTALNQRTLCVHRSGPPELHARSLSRDTLQVDMQFWRAGATAKVAFELYPLEKPHTRFDLSHFEMRLEHIGTGDVIWGITSNDHRSILFEGLRYSEPY